MKIYTIGFTRKHAETFFNILRESGTKRVIDVRLRNESQLAGFAKKEDLAFFVREICGIEYLHLPELAPTADLLDAYKKAKGSWAEYEQRFLALMEKRKIEDALDRKVLSNGCLLCSEDKPHQCHRRLVAEYLAERWGNVLIKHLGV